MGCFMHGEEGSIRCSANSSTADGARGALTVHDRAGATAESTVAGGDGVANDLELASERSRGEDTAIRDEPDESEVLGAVGAREGRLERRVETAGVVLGRVEVVLHIASILVPSHGTVVGGRAAVVRQALRTHQCPVRVRARARRHPKSRMVEPDVVCREIRGGRHARHRARGVHDKLNVRRTANVEVDAHAFPIKAARAVAIDLQCDDGAEIPAEDTGRCTTLRDSYLRSAAVPQAGVACRDEIGTENGRERGRKSKHPKKISRHHVLWQQGRP
jgi:hypothetical protein